MRRNGLIMRSKSIVQRLEPRSTSSWLLCLALVSGVACTSDDDNTAGQAGTSGSAGRAGAGGSSGKGGSSGSAGASGSSGMGGTAGMGGAGSGTTGGAGSSGSGGGIDASAGSGGVGGMDEDASDGAGGSAGRDGPVPDASCPTCSIGLALYWKFDEPSGTTALDSSGNNFNGLYTGITGTPTASTLVPPVGFPDPFSRAFSLANQQAVQLANAPATLKPANDLTVAVWYRSTMTDSTGSELVSLGDQYLLRLRQGQLEWTKNTPRDGGTNYVHCFANLPNTQFLDGNWHHIAGITTAAGMQLYFDGALQCSNTSGATIAYTVNGGTDLWVGRHGTQKTAFDFDGNLDDVRIYTRALSASEVLGLFQGAGNEGTDAAPDVAIDAGSPDVSAGSDAEPPDASADAGAPEAGD